MTTPDADQFNDALAANYLLVEVRLCSWSGRSTDRTASDELLAQKGAAKDGGKFVKNLLASAGKELKDVHQAGNTLRHFVYNNTLPWSAADTGAQRGERLLAASLSMNFLQELKQLQKEHDAAVAILAAVWPTRVGEAMHALGTLADATDYPDASELPGLFSVTVDFHPIPTVGDFSRVNVPAALAGALAEQHTVKAQTQIDNAMANLRERICDELQRIHTMLGKHARGDKTRLYDSLVTNMQGLVQLARSMNIGDNPKLIELADKIEASLLRVPVEAYKEDPQKAAVASDSARALLTEANLEDVWTFSKQ